MMTTKELVWNYEITGDMIAIILCILLLLIMNVTYMKKDKRRILLLSAVVLMIVGSGSNIMFCELARTESPAWALYLSRDVYHFCMLSMIKIEFAYFRYLIVMPREYSRKLILSFDIMCMIWWILDCLSPITHFGFYRDAKGMWHDPENLKPFTLAYVVCTIIIVGVLIYWRKKMDKKVFTLLMSVVILGNAVGVISTAFESKTYFTFTFILPVIAIMFAFHSNSYNVYTGARDFQTLSYYLRERYDKGKGDFFVCVKMSVEDRNSAALLNESADAIYLSSIAGAELFASDNYTFVLVIKPESNKDYEKTAVELVENRIVKRFEQSDVHYKIVLMPTQAFQNIDMFETAMDYYFGGTRLDSWRVLAGKDKEEFERAIVVLDIMRDMALRNNLDDERILVYCQPVKNMETGGFDTAEALMRMRIPNLGMVYPNTFIPLAEQYGLIHTLSKIMLNKTCKQLKKLLNEGYKVTRVSVNFSIAELNDKYFIDDFRNIIRNNGLDYSMIGVELTESRNDSDYELIIRIVSQLKELGVKIYLDDFGTGYSNYERIVRLNLDVIKFDRSLLLMSDENKISGEIMAYFSEPFLKLGYTLLYEGVERDEHEKICANCGAAYLQGYKFSKPIPMEEYSGFLTKE